MGSKRLSHPFFLVFVLILSAVPGSGQPSTYAALVSSASGNEEFKAKFREWSSLMVRTLTEDMNVPKDNVYLLMEDPGQGLAVATSKATKVEMMKVLEGLQSKIKEGDCLLLLLIGHGSFDGNEYKFNLVGPDITGSELKTQLNRFNKQQVVLVGATPSSGVLTRVLSGANRVIVTATKSEFENNDTVFAQFFVEAFQKGKADTDKNRQVSVLEAYLYTAQRVESWYKEQGRLATEHPLLEDNGDQTGTARPSPANGEGLLAAKIGLGEAAAMISTTQAEGAATPGLQALQASKQRIEGAIQELKYKKAALSEAEYAKQLETLLIQLAQTNQKINALNKK
jgi:hypothetical protein